MPKPKKNVGENLQTWVVRDVDPQTRLLVRVYAVIKRLTTAQALKELVDAGIRENFEEVQRYVAEGWTADTDLDEMMELARLMREIRQMRDGSAAADADEPGE